MSGPLPIDVFVPAAEFRAQLEAAALDLYKAVRAEATNNGDGT